MRGSPDDGRGTGRPCNGPLDRSVDDLQAHWGVARHQRWVADTPARPGRHPEPVQAARPAPHAQERLIRSRSDRRGDVQRRLIDLHDDYDALLAGTGRWAGTPAGRAAVSYTQAADRLAAARKTAMDPDASRRERRAAAKSLPQFEGAVHAAEQYWSEVGVPEAARLQRDITATDRELTKLSGAAMNERLDGMQARGAERAVGLDRGLGL